MATKKTSSAKGSKKVTEIPKTENKEIMVQNTNTQEKNTKEECAALNPNLCIIVREPSSSSNTTSRHIGVSQEVYDQLQDLSVETGRSLRWLANKLFEYAFKNIQLVD